MNVTINGKKVSAREGETILDLARRERIFVPSLCHDEKLEPYSSCWVCAVKVKNENRLKPACATRVMEGMEIITENEEIRTTRRLCLELLLSDHCGDCLPPCQLACPAGCDARGYTQLIMDKRYDEALRLIMETVPLPATIGRICPHPCEDECRREIVEEPVSICALKRFVSDRVKRVKPPRKKRPTGKRVAIIGSGPAGLSAAYYLALEGHSITILEARKEAGGMLRYCIPAYRLPKDVLDREIETIQRLGVRIECDTPIGMHNTIPDLLRKGYDAVLIAVGAQLNRTMGIKGEDIEGVFDGIDFLADVASGNQPVLGGTVFVVGGGDTAIDAARTALRLGAEDVSIVYRRSREEMPARRAEIASAEAEGVHIRFLTLPLRVERNRDHLEVTCIRMALGETDASGRRKPVPIPGSEFTIRCTSVVMAIGQSVDTSVLNGSGLKPSPRERIESNAVTMETGMRGVFAAGDCVTGPDIAISAIAAGRRAACGIDSYLKTGRITPMQELFSPARRRKAEIVAAEYGHVESQKRAAVDELHAEERVRGFPEIEKVLDEDAALHEAYRCLDCGCEVVKECTLRELSGIYGAGVDRFGSPPKRFVTDERHPYIVRDPDKCIKCARCIRVCLEVQGIAAWCNIGRGFDMQVAPPFGGALQDTDCESCGQCVTACPTGALTEKPLLPKSISVLGETTDTTCAHCGVGCAVTVHSAGYRIHKITPQQNGNLCEKGKFKFGYLTDTRRIIFPKVRRGERLTRVRWSEAERIFRDSIHGVSGKELAVFVSPRSTDEEAFTAQKLARTVLKTNNIYPLGVIMHSRKFYRKPYQFKSACSINSMEGADCIILLDPHTIDLNEVAALPMIGAVRKGARLFIIGRRRTKLDTLAYKKYRLDSDQTERYMRLLAEFLKEAKRPILVFNRDCLGEKASSAVYALSKSTGLRTVPLRTEINAQGLLTAGVSPFLLPGHVSIGDRAARRKLEKKWKSRVPAWYGRDQESIVKAMQRGEIKAAMLLGAPVSLEKEFLRGLAKVRFVAAQALFPSPLTRAAHLVLPAASWVETRGSFTRYDGKKLRLRKALPPLCGYSNMEIWRGLFK